MLQAPETPTVGVLLDPFITPPLDRVRIQQFAVAMSDPNPVHTDEAFCRYLGLAGIIAPGGMAVVALAHSVARHYGAEAIAELDVTLKAPALESERLVCYPEVVAADGGALELACRVTNEAGDLKAEGRVVVRR
ncbi:MAG TPA: MaoC/PaaZ C-terminal domain-containing protein, partial [Acidimicrobiia bacterium]|nr:MaoC/PaaZ C-terminal domain-containing protein [Acidimicrobiia bacterium]